MSAVVDEQGHHADDHHDHGPAKGLLRWITTTNHKDIGTLYLLFALLMFFVGGAMAMVFERNCLSLDCSLLILHFSTP